MSLTPERERQLDSVLRAAMVVDPPLDLQARLSRLVAVESVAMFAARDRTGGSLGLTRPAPAARSDWAVYLGVACILAAYLGIGGWLTVSVVVELLVDLGRTAALLLASPILPSLRSLATDHIAWLALIPVVLFLWDRDRSEAGSARQPSA